MLSLGVFHDVEELFVYFSTNSFGGSVNKVSTNVYAGVQEDTIQAKQLVQKWCSDFIVVFNN